MVNTNQKNAPNVSNVVSKGETHDNTAMPTHSKLSLTSRSKQSRKYDIVLYGATSYVGKLTAAYLQQFISMQDASHRIKWAIAGRNEDKLNKIKIDIGNNNLPLIIADSEDSQSLDIMVKQTQVVISTVGPYLRYGELLIKACVTYGTDYVDLTGEALFIKDMMDKYQDAATQSGARIVNACGFDAIPSDLGVLFTQNCAKETYGAYCHTINMRVKAAKGDLSGGTIASMAAIFEEIGGNKARQKQLSNPYLLTDTAETFKVRQKNVTMPTWDAENKRWLAPFIMASINTRIVHRSNQLSGYQYGHDFKYDEAMWMSGNLKGRLISYGISAGMAGFAVGMMFKPSRHLLNHYILPKAGSGPTKEQRDNGYFDIRFIGHINQYQAICIKVTGDKDPGYGSTCRMLAQSAICLAQDISQEEVAGGFLTPASAMGEYLIDRLQNYAGIKFSRILEFGISN